MPLFVAVNEVISPVPLAAKPMPVFVFVQLYTVPVTAPAKTTVAVELPLQITWFDTAFAVGVGFTVRVVTCVSVPVHVNPALVKVGVTEIVPEIGATPGLVAAKLEILPVPEAAIPMFVLVFVQL